MVPAGPAPRPGPLPRARSDKKPAVSAPQGTIRHDPASPGLPHRPPESGSNGTPAHPDTLGALGNPDGQQPDITDA